jgi:hypothetical protein
MITDSLEYAQKIVGTKYEWWINGMNTMDIDEPFWAKNDSAPDAYYILKKTCNCAGLINLVKRFVNGNIPYVNFNYEYAGGVWAWYDYLNNQSLLDIFETNKSYTKGTLLIRKYKDEHDQGHLAIIYNSNDLNPLKSKIIHSYSYEHYDGTNKITNPGITIEDLEISVNWTEEPFYHYVVHPDKWLLDN